MSHKDLFYLMFLSNILAVCVFGRWTTILPQ